MCGGGYSKFFLRQVCCQGSRRGDALVAKTVERATPERSTAAMLKVDIVGKDGWACHC